MDKLFKLIIKKLALMQIFTSPLKKFTFYGKLFTLNEKHMLKVAQNFTGHSKIKKIKK